MMSLVPGLGLPYLSSRSNPTAAQLGRELLWLETDPTGYFSSSDYTITNNADPTPDQYDATANKGTAGGTFGGAGTARHSVAYNVGGGRARRVMLDDGSNDAAASSLAASAWSALHTGDAHVLMTLRLHASGAGDLLATCDNLSETGLRVAIDGADKVQVDLCNGTGTAYLTATTAAALTVGNQYLVEVVRSGTTLTVTAYDYLGASETTGTDNTTAGAAPAGAPAKTATIGGAAGNYSAVLAGSAVLNNAALLRDYLRTKYCDAWWEELMRALDGGLYAAASPSFYSLSGSNVSRIIDLSGRARDCYTIAGGTVDEINGEPAFLFSGSSITAIVSPGLGFDSSTTHHAFFTIEPDSATGRNKFLMDSTSGRLVAAQFGNLPNKLGIFTGAAWTCDAADPSAAAQLLEYEIQGTAQVARRDKVQIDTDTGTSTTLGGTTRYFSRNNSPSISLYEGRAAAWGRGSAAISGATLTSLQTKLLSLGGL